MINIFVTGGTGFIGSHFINAALNEKYNVFALKRTRESGTKIKLDIQPNWIIKSMYELSEQDFSGIDVLVHFAAHSANYPYDTLENCIEFNVIQPLQIFREAKKAGVTKIIVAGSCFEYGKSGERFKFIPVNAPLEPTQTYPASKAISSIAFNQFAIQENIQLSYLRIFQVFGEGEAETRLWPSLKKAAIQGDDFPMTFGEQIRDFISVEVVAFEFLEEVRNILNRQTLEPKFRNIGSGKPQSILEFSSYWWRKWEAKGDLLIGVIPYRNGEVMRFVPEIKT